MFVGYSLQEGLADVSSADVPTAPCSLRYTHLLCRPGASTNIAGYFSFVVVFEAAYAQACSDDPYWFTRFSGCFVDVDSRILPLPLEHPSGVDDVACIPPQLTAEALQLLPCI